MPQTEQASRSVVFLSYSRADRVAAEIASRLLRDAGFSVWIDNTNLAPGTASWQAAIEQAINQSQIIVVLLSPEAKASEWVGIEVGYAKLINLRIIPVLFRGTVHNAVPLTLINTQWIDATQNVQAAIQEKLIPTLKQYLHANERSTNETIDHRLTTIAANGAPVAVLTSSPTPHSTRTEGNTGTSSHWWTMTAATVALVAVIAAFFLVSLMKDTANLTDQFNRQTTTAPTMVATAIAIQDRFAASIPTRLPVGKFGVVIAGFGFSEQESMVTASPLADEVSDIISSAMKEIPEIDIVQDWRSPGIGRILSAAPSERERQAAALAELLGADVVIYGTVSSEGLIVTIEPEFYIAPTSLTMIEPEIAGALRFETPSRFVHDSDDQLLTAASDLQQYMSETRVLMRGLGTYFGGNFPAAIEAFQEIIEANPTHSEILHLLAGNAAIREGQLSVAMDHYQSALASQPNYGRAFIGKGNVYFSIGTSKLGAAHHHTKLYRDNRSKQRHRQ